MASMMSFRLDLKSEWKEGPHMLGYQTAAYRPRLHRNRQVAQALLDLLHVRIDDRGVLLGNSWCSAPPSWEEVIAFAFCAAFANPAQT